MDNEETKKLEEMLERGSFSYEGINPSSGWDRRNFVDEFFRLNDILKYEKQMKEAQGALSTGLKEDLSDVLTKDKSRKFAKLSDELLKYAGKEARKMGQKDMAEWTRNNLSSLYEEIDSSEQGNQIYVGLALTSPLCLTGNKDHDYTVGLISKLKDAEEAIEKAKKGDIGKMRKIVEAKVKNQKIPEWGRKLINKFIGDEQFVQMLFHEEYQARQNLAVLNISGDNEGKTADKSKIKLLIEESLKKKWEFYHEETNDSKKGDIYDDEIVPLYNAIAGNAFQVAHARLERDSIDANPEIQEMIERAKKREQYGVGVDAGDIVEILEDRKKAGH